MSHEGGMAMLHCVEVRPICRDERSVWDDLMGRHHYLGFRSLVGESLRYVATLQGQWVALLGWSAAALKCKVRDRWIGWPAWLQYQRLSLLANNSRFLILPDVEIPNLASRVLALNVKRLSRDWQQLYGHPIWLAESFVDPRYFQGTCYKAAGWSFLGYTHGFSKSAHIYRLHNQPKMVFVQPLDAHAREKLAEPSVHLPLRREIKAMELSKKQAADLIDRLKGIPDPRMARGIRHKKISVVAISICAMISNARSFKAIAEFAQRCSQKMLKRLWCRYDRNTERFVPPSEPTIRRFLQSVDAEAVDKVLVGWFQQLANGPLEGKAVAVDGKTLKGARQENGRKVHLLSAFLHQQGIVLNQCQVESKTNEITTIRPLLDPLELEGCVVTADAMHAQKDTASYLVEEKHADFVLTVKDNQPTLREDIEAFNMSAFPP
jgi:hypothetical protein